MKAAIDTYYAERGSGLSVDELQATIQMEIMKLQQLIDVPALSVSDVRGVLLASAGPYAAAWPPGARVGSRIDDSGQPVETIVARPPGPFRATAVPLVLGRDVIGEFFIAAPLDNAHAALLAAEAGADIVILLGGEVVASSMPEPVTHALADVALPHSGSVVVGPDEFVVRRVSVVDGPFLRPCAADKSLGMRDYPCLASSTSAAQRQLFLPVRTAARGQKSWDAGLSVFGVKYFCRSTSTILAGSDGCSFDDAPFAGRCCGF